MTVPTPDAGAVVEDFCASCRGPVLTEIQRLIAAHGWADADLERLILEYPLRPAKALRPALCLATARALGATDEGVLGAAAVVELLHNAFLIHDDVEDESWFRRGEPTLQRAHGLAIAVNVGDAMFALSLSGLLDNTEMLGLRATLEIVQTIATMMRVTVGGQATELAWIRNNRWRADGVSYQSSYEDLVVRKTATYSFIAPVSLGCIAAATPASRRATLEAFARSLGIAFQIADDLLNLRDDTPGYGKEVLGDLWEGKRSLMLLHALHAEDDPAVVARADAILAARRPPPDGAREPGVTYKTAADVAWLAKLLRRHGSAAHARTIALEHAAAAARTLAACRDQLAAGGATRFLAALPQYVVERLR